MIRRELLNPARIPFGKRLWGWRHGFLSASVLHYALDDENVSEYASDTGRFLRSHRINGPMCYVLDNKLVFTNIITGLGCDATEYFCLIHDGVYTQIGEKHRMRSADDIVEAVLSGDRFIVKPYGGGGGVGVTVLASVAGRPTINGVEHSRAELRAFLARLRNAVISEFIYQHEYASRIFPDTTNSLRILTMWDYEKDEPFIATAVHRFGVSTSIPVDNGSRGGLIALIDNDTGVLSGCLFGHACGGALVPHPVHSETNEPIDGVQIPNWETTRAGLLDLARKMSYVPYIGWDVVITDAGFTVIEGNSHPDVRHQVLLPLLKDPRARAFYERFDAL